VALRSFRVRFLLGFLLLLAALCVTRGLWLPVFGYALIHDDGPAKADIAIVLAGDTYGHRILKAAEMVKQGYVPAVLVSGPAGQYGQYESDLAIPFAVRHGYPAGWFIPFPNSSLSTHDEAIDILAELRRRNVHSFLLVTSSYHTARAARTYRSLAAESGGGLTFRTVAAPAEFFLPDSWWRVRESRKFVLSEWTKTIAAVFGL
jgi:uncharacterized SAM-binding protein YcdF (DUF218 family)